MFSSTTDAGISIGDEIFNNYGFKANDQLMLKHGFALDDNPGDTYPLQLMVGSGDAATAPLQLGPFFIHRAGATSEQCRE